MAARSRNKNALTPITRNEKGTVSSPNIDQLSEESRVLYMLITSKFESSFLELEKKLKLRDERIEMLEREIAAVRKCSKDLADRLDDIESENRSDTLIISGNEVPISEPHEDVSLIVQGITRNKLKCEVKREYIPSARRMGNKNASQRQDRRRILVKFRERGLRDDLLQAARKAKPAGLYMNEHFSRTRTTILYAARQAKKRYPEKVDGCGSLRGSVFINCV